MGAVFGECVSMVVNSRRWSVLNSLFEDLVINATGTIRMDTVRCDEDVVNTSLALA